MNFALLVIAALGITVLIAVLSANKIKSAQKILKQALSEKGTLDEKLGALRKEISSLKEENARKAKLLEETRENAKKKLKKQGMKADGEDATADSLIPQDGEVDRLKKALHAMESQLRSMQSETDRLVARTKKDIQDELNRDLESAKKEIHHLNELLGQKKDHATRQKRSLQQTLGSVNLEPVADDVITELARVLKKSEHYEKMHGIAQGKFQMAQERYTEMQKRYFAVCRELALAAGQEPSISDEEARNAAEDIIARAEVPAAAIQSESTPSSEAHSS